MYFHASALSPYIVCSLDSWQGYYNFKKSRHDNLLAKSSKGSSASGPNSLKHTSKALKNLLMRVKKESEKAGLKLNLKKNWNHVIQSHHFMANIRRLQLFFLSSKITTDSNCNPEIRRQLLLWRKAMTNLDSILNSRDIILLTKVHIVRAIVFPVVVYGCELDHKEGSKWKVQALSHVQLFATSLTVACQVPPSMRFSRQEYRSELPFPSPGALPDPGIELGSPALQADSLPSEPPGKPKEGWVPNNWCFQIMVLEKTLESPWTSRRVNQSILKEINPEYSLEGLMLKLKLQYFGHLVQRADLLEKTLMLGKIEGRRRRG